MRVLILVCLLVASCYADQERVEAEENNFFEGDMILSPEQMSELAVGKLSFSSSKYLWKKNQAIPYYVAASLKGTQGESQIKAAISNYHSKTCIRFRPYRRGDQSYLYFYKGGGCSSPVGYGLGRRTISLARGCWRIGTVQHEIGHSLGLYHEQSRPDRDQYVDIIWNNVRSDRSNNFKLAAGSIRHTNYDYDSMMHYGGYAFSKNRGMTIRTKDSRFQNRIGQRNGFSRIDIMDLNKMYC